MALELPAVGRLPIDPAEAGLAVRYGLRRAGEVDVSRRVVDLVAEHAAAGPERTAVRAPDATLTYGALLAATRALAGDLAAAGCAAGDVLAVPGPRGAATVVAFLAVELVGGVYLPLDERWPDERVADVLRDSGTWAVLGRAAVPAGIPVHPIPLVPPAVSPPSWPDRPDRPASAPDEPRYLFYTSGTTGRPKGAVIEQRGMLNHLWAKVVELSLGPDDAVALTAPVTFDISLWQMLAPLLVGGRVVVVGEQDLAFPRRLIGVLESAEVNVLELVPTALWLMMEEVRRKARAETLPALRHLLATGEELPPALAGLVLDLFPSVPLLNAYGPTECADDVTHHRVSRRDADGHRVPIGRPLPNTALYVLSPHGDRWRAAAPGEVGELFVGGLGVGRGYHHRPGRTSAAFFVDPFDPGSPTGRVYRTGDLVRVNERGELEYLGRRDRQVKVGGVRMELGEIEARLLLHPGVRFCAVVVRDGARRAGLAGYYVPAGDPLDARDLEDHLGRQLPAAMVPRRWTVLGNLPLTGNGKVDYAALPDPP